MQDNERLARLEERMDTMEELISGPPWETSVRGRVHRLIDSDTAAKAAEAALVTARELRDQGSRRRWSKLEIACAVLFGAIVAFSTLTTLIVLLTQHHTG